MAPLMTAPKSRPVTAGVEWWGGVGGEGGGATKQTS
jgi:hypothetical protein